MLKLVSVSSFSKWEVLSLHKAMFMVFIFLYKMVQNLIAMVSVAGSDL